MSDYHYNPAYEASLTSASQWQSEAVQLRQENAALRESLHRERLSHAECIHDIAALRLEVRELQCRMAHLQTEPATLNAKYS